MHPLLLLLQNQLVFLRHRCIFHFFFLLFECVDNHSSHVERVDEGWLLLRYRSHKDSVCACALVVVVIVVAFFFVVVVVVVVVVVATTR